MPDDSREVFEAESDDALETSLKESEVNKAVVAGADWTIGSLLDQLKKGIIDIDPRFQRRDVWKIEQKSRYIESLFLHLPVPQIVLAEHRVEGGRTKFLVLDGRQRLLSIMQFTGLASVSNNNSFRLRKLDVIERANGKTYAALRSADDVLIEQFENATVRCVVVRGWAGESFLHLLFSRLNTGSVKLNAQELRLALYPGPFVHFAHDQAPLSVGIRRILKLRGDEAHPRMDDVELLIRYFAFRNLPGVYRGPLRPYLDTVCKELNKKWLKDGEAEFQRQMADLEFAMAEGFEIFGEHFGCRYAPETKSYSDRRNLALIDVLLLHLSYRPKVPQSAEVRNAWRSVVEQAFMDPTFVDAIEATARHAKEGVARFELFSKLLEINDISTSAVVPTLGTDV